MISFTSVLEDHQQSHLERLLFFNANQDVVSDQITTAFDKFGPPRVTVTDGKLRLGFASHFDPQSLFIVDDTDDALALAGVVVYYRDDYRLKILFIAVHEDFCCEGSRSDQLLLLQVIQELRSIGRRIKGISELSLRLDTNRLIQIAV